MTTLQVERPIKTKSEDFLNREYFSENLSQAILNYSDEESLTIGFYGKWGSGKTSIVNMAVEGLEKEDGVVIVRFDPWNFSDTQQLISQFFKEFGRAIRYKDAAENAMQIGEELETYATFFKPMALTPEPIVSLLSILSSEVFGSVGKAAKKWGDLKTKTLQDTKESIEELLKKQKKKILIVIDDIDRLNNTEIRQIFQMVKTLGNFPNTMYLLLMDKDVVINALSEVQKGDGLEYLEKVIHVPFDVPPLSKNDVEKFLLQKLDEILKDVKEEDFDQTYWGNVFLSGIKYFFNNIRDVTRYINVLKFNYALIKGDVNIIDLIAVTAIQVFEPKAYEVIKNNGEVFTGVLSERYHGNENEKDNAKKIYEESCEVLQKISKDEYISLLKVLFLKVESVYGNMGYGHEWLESRRKESKISSSEFFDAYFKLSLNDGEISNVTIKHYISQTNSEEEFRKLILKLNEDGLIIRFLERIQDYTKDEILEENFQTIMNVLMDLSDLFPEGEKGMFSEQTNMQVMRIFYQLTHRFKDKEKRYNLFRKAMENAENSIYTMAHEISIQMQQHGEYGEEPKSEENLTLTKHRLDDLKKIFENKIQFWIKKETFVEHAHALSVLYLWLCLDKDKTLVYVKKLIDSNAGLLQFLKLFVSIGHSQSGNDYVSRSTENFNYDGIKKFLDVDKISNRIKGIYQNFDEKNDVSEKSRFVVTCFISMYDGEPTEEKEVNYVN